jgi:hypothetical protein
MAEPKRFAVCIRNEGNEASLELRKIYEVLADEKLRATRWFGHRRENEDYLYPASWFLPIELPTKVEQAQ